MDDPTRNLIVTCCAIVGASLGIVNSAIIIWDKLLKDRLKLDFTYSFSGQDGTPDEITIVNLTGTPVQIAYWKLTWKNNFVRLNKRSIIDAIPDEMGGKFIIAPKSDHTLSFADENKIGWDAVCTRNHQLYLSLYMFGRNDPKILKIVKRNKHQ